MNYWVEEGINNFLSFHVKYFQWCFQTYAEVRLEIEGTKLDISGDKISETTIQVEDDSSRPENLPSKVMIVTGDSQNIVVDLRWVFNQFTV